MGRRSNEQICIDLRKERAKLYSKRGRLSKKRKSKENNLELKKIEKRLSAIKEQLFRCGKKFTKFKGQRQKLRRHQYYLQSKVVKIREKMQDPSLTKKDHKALNKELNIIGTYKRKTAEEIHMIEKVMELPIGTVQSSVGIDKGIIAVKGGKFFDQDVIWVMTSNWKIWLNSGYFDTLVLDNEIYDMADNPLIADIAVHEAYDWAMAWQHVYGTPHFFVYGDVDSGYLEIKVKEYTTDLYDVEMARHGKSIS